ncbi:DoxX family protein [Cytophaga aurantiaca]|uniref:DoxX family protein n=1 Tax=Cytophaga aurantiaca TaxID=29530 RepID=UPI000379E4E6|nr:MauE/DoxX family redox-associated membrane protein [Cytophaga aurantiaca]
MRNNNQALVWVFRFIVAILFIFSAYTKLIPIEAFEKQLVDQGITNWCFAPILARCIISFEFFLGIAFLQNHYFKKFILPATALMLIAFCIHLTYQMITQGNSGNCGCMGQIIPMTPLQALIKNVITLGLLAYIFFNYKIIKDQKHRYPIFILLACFAIIFWKYRPVCGCDAGSTAVAPQTNVIEPIIKIDTVYVEKPVNGKGTKTPTIDPKKTPLTKTEPIKTEPVADVKPGLPKTTSIFAPYKNFSTGITTNLDAGKNIVCLFNVDCDHCMNTCKELIEIHKTNKLPPVYILFWGEESQKDAFFKFAGGSFPYAFVDAGKFFRLLDKAPSPPRIVVLDEGNIVGDFTSDTFKKQALLDAVNK